MRTSYWELGQSIGAAQTRDYHSHIDLGCPMLTVMVTLLVIEMVSLHPTHHNGPARSAN